MSMLFALAGNPNSGKTTLFNALTGARQHVGNWAGVTVEKKQGMIQKNGRSGILVDLPGIYSLSPHSQEETVARQFLLEAHPDCIIALVDATNLERNLYLVLQLAEFGMPMVIALNMIDEVEQRGQSIDHIALGNALNGVPVVPISAKTGHNLDLLLEAAFVTAHSWRPAPERSVYSFFPEQAIQTVSRLVEPTALAQGIRPRWAAIKIIEGDTPILKRFLRPGALREECARTVVWLEQNSGRDAEALLANERYELAGMLSRQAVQNANTAGPQLSGLDSLLLNRYLGLPVFFLLMFLVFQATFGSAGQWLSDGVALAFSKLGEGLGALLGSIGAPALVQSLLVECLIEGLGSVLTFAPQIMILFFFLSVMEDTGYMARAACLMDRLLSKIGLSGKAFIPMIMGFGCSVPALMATRTLEKDSDRRLALMVVPLLSCGARLPIYALFAQVFFDGNRGVLLFLLYLLSILAAVLVSFVLSRTAFRGKTGSFVMELPPYRVPGAKSTLLHLWEKLREFVVRAGTVILLASVAVWLLKSFTPQLTYTQDTSSSLFAQIGHFLAPVFAPAGFGDWRAASALLSGLVAKEAVLSTLAMLYGFAPGTAQAAAVLSQAFTPASALCYMVFVALYTPCIAALVTQRKELGSWRHWVMAFIFQLLVAYGCAAMLRLILTLAGLA